MFTVTLVTYKDGIRQEEFIQQQSMLSIIEEWVKMFNEKEQENVHLFTYHIHSQKYNDINKKAEEHFWLQYKEI